MNLSTFIVLAVLVVVIAADVRYLLKNGIDSCGGDCSGCGSGCKWVNDVQKARKSIERRKKLKRILHIQ